MPELQKWKIDKDYFVVERKFSFKPYQAVKLSEVIGIELIHDKSLLSLLLVLLFATVASFFYNKLLFALLLVLTLLLGYEYWERGKATLILTKAGPILLRGHHPELKDLF